ncbi:hypothetical protein T492DRAFT_884675 [Pavlovales sp. CCMP2436]|nr:hypothetical protein T492DRAFT_884675 [Pavlovales sp. CCMP2436]
MYALMGVSPIEAAARIKKQLIDTIGTIVARGHAQLLLARLSAFAPIAVQRGNTTNSNQQIISLNALARAHYRRSIGTRDGKLWWIRKSNVGGWDEDDMEGGGGGDNAAHRAAS